MNRRDLITVFGGIAVAWPFRARAQQSNRMRRIGVLMGWDENDPEAQFNLAAFVQGLQQLGWAAVATFGSIIVGPMATSIGCGCSRKNWSTCNLT
jgi:hypothetical protein